jgi:hypothetical protein
VDHELGAVAVLFLGQNHDRRDGTVVEQPFEFGQPLIDEISKWSGDLHMAACDVNAHKSVSSSQFPASSLVSYWQLETGN